MAGKLVLLLCCVVLFGCQPEEEISSYETKSTGPPRQPVDSMTLQTQLDHTLVAIILDGKKAWFFKLAAPAGPAARQRKAMLSFLSSVKLDPEGAAPTWKLPEDWEEKGPSMMRTATLVVPDKDGPLEIAVSQLPYRGDWDHFLLVNVNRWLRQLQQPKLDGETIGKLVQKIDIQDGTATFVELTGTKEQRPRGPHAAMSQGAPAAPVAPAAPKSKALTYETPEGWALGRTSPIREAAFQIVDGEDALEVTVIPFTADAGQQITDVQANVVEWARQTKLDDLSPEELMKRVKPVTVGGAEGSYIELFGSEKSILAAMLERDGKVWFFKMYGSDALVQSQRVNFRAFLDSVRFR